MMAACSHCVDASDDDNIQRPLGVKYDDFADYIRVSLAIPGIKKAGPFSNHPSRNTIVDAKFYEQSLRIDVQVHSSGNLNIKYLYKVKLLPEKIAPELCTHRIGKNKIVLTIRKKSVGSWLPTLETKGLETADDI